MSRYGPLAAAIGLLIGAAFETTDKYFSSVLLGAGLICLGAWLAVEVWHMYHVYLENKSEEEIGDK
jgi:hypothetical protein